MPHLSAEQKRHQKELRRKKRFSHHQPAHSTDFMPAITGPLSEYRPQIGGTIWHVASMLVDTRHEPVSHIESALQFACHCWNMSIFEGIEKDETCEDDNVSPTWRDDFPATDDKHLANQAVEELTRIRHKYFQDEDRIITGFTLSDDGHEFSLNIALASGHTV